ncbi:MAG: glutathione S-transferase family protein, partial [Paracoccaceae bacterium]
FSGKFAGQADEMKDAASRVHAELALYETILGQSNYLAGDEISAADATLFPTVQQILRAGNNQPEVMEGLGFIPFDQHFANISAWIKRIEAMPGYDKTYPPHWR